LPEISCHERSHLIFGIRLMFNSLKVLIWYRGTYSLQSTASTSLIRHLKPIIVHSIQIFPRRTVFCILVQYRIIRSILLYHVSDIDKTSCRYFICLHDFFLGSMYVLFFIKNMSDKFYNQALENRRFIICLQSDSICIWLSAGKHIFQTEKRKAFSGIFTIRSPVQDSSVQEKFFLSESDLYRIFMTVILLCLPFQSCMIRILFASESYERCYNKIYSSIWCFYCSHLFLKVSSLSRYFADNFRDDHVGRILLNSSLL